MLFVLTRLNHLPFRRARRDFTLGFILLALVAVIWLPRLNGPIDLRWDASVYYILGTSLAEGKGYKLLNEPGDIEAIQYPPLLPLIVAGHQWVLGTNDPIVVGPWLRRSFFVIFGTYILTVYLMLKNFLPPGYAFFGTLLCLFNLHTYFISDLLFPEIPFALATTLFVLCQIKDSRRIYSFLAGFLAGVSFALRSIGIALLAAWIAESLFNRDYKRAAIRFTTSLIPILFWQSYIYSVESGPQYNNPVYEYQRADYMFYNVSYARNIFGLKDSFSPESGGASIADITNRFLHNLTEIPVSFGEAVTSKKAFWDMEWAEIKKRLPFPLTARLVDFVLIALGFLALGGSGIGLLLSTGQSIISAYVLFCVALMCLTPWPGQFSRYLVPLAPFLALSVLKLLLILKEKAGEILSARAKATGLVVIGSVVCIIFLQQVVTLFLVYTKWHSPVTYEDQNGNEIRYHLFFYHDSYRTLDRALDWLKSRAKPGDIVAASMPHWVHLRTGLKTVMSPFELDPAKAQDLLDSVPVSYLILDEGLAVDTRRYNAPVLEKFPDLWKRVYSDSLLTESGQKLTKRFEIYQRVGLESTDNRLNDVLAVKANEQNSDD